MAVNPAFQWITERRFVHSTISVLTNSRPDHQDLMGDSIESITMCLSNTIPEKGVFFTSEVEQFAILKSVADKRNTETHQILPDGITIEELDGFSYIEHPENVALSLSICAHLGISRKTALKGMQKAIPDPGALTKYKISDSGKNMQFYNVFAANEAHIFGIGNIAGKNKYGAQIVNYFREKSKGGN